MFAVIIKCQQLICSYVQMKKFPEPLQQLFISAVSIFPYQLPCVINRVYSPLIDMSEGSSRQCTEHIRFPKAGEYKLVIEDNCTQRIIIFNIF